MRFSLVAAALFSSVVSVLAADHLILVGDNSTLTFNPNNITAAEGDTVTFEFRSKNHSATQSTFASPCTRMTTPALGVDSGFQAVANGTTSFAQWKITLQNVSAPMWFFCGQTNPKNHCQSGMVFSINANANKTFSQYLANAMNELSVVNATSPTANSSTGATTASSTTAAVAGASSASSVGVASAGATSGTMSTSLGSVATSAVPAAASPLSGAAVTGSNSTSTNAPGSSAMRLGTSTASGLLVAGLVAGLML